jgi:hypothetical protein
LQRTSSSTSTNGTVRLASKRCKRGTYTLLKSTDVEVISARWRAEIGSISDSAAATFATNTAGSSSTSVIDTHATGRSSACAASVNSVVLPYPAPATSAITVHSCAARIRSTRRGRATTPVRNAGTCETTATTRVGHYRRATRDHPNRMITAPQANR